jgi:hypothetical protein
LLAEDNAVNHRLVSGMLEKTEHEFKCPVASELEAAASDSD